MKNKLIYFFAALVFAPMLILFAAISGCGTDSTTNPVYTANPNVKFNDSVGVEERINGTSLCGINLFTQVNTTANSLDKDMLLIDSNSTGYNFFLQSGDYRDMPTSGYSARFFQVRDDMSATEFDTLSQVRENIGSAFDTLDFTQDNTVAWGYFNADTTLAEHNDKHPVYCVYLQGKYWAGQTSKRVYAIVRLRDIVDNIPGVGGVVASFSIRINTNGENDFRKNIQQ